MTTGPNTVHTTVQSHLVIIILSPQLPRVVGLNSDRRELVTSTTGTLNIVPAQSEVYARWETPKESFSFELSPDRMRQLAISEFDDDVIDLEPPRLGHIDRNALMMAKMLEPDFARAGDGLENTLYVDSVLTILSTHLLRSYSQLGRRPAARSKGGIAPSVLGRVIDFVHAHMSRNISLAELAEVAGYSPSHFTRAFRQSTGRAPHSFFLELRLKEVERLVSTGDLPLPEISRLTGFSSPSHMTATMQKHWSVTPSALRRNAGNGRGRMVRMA